LKAASTLGKKLTGPWHGNSGTYETWRSSLLSSTSAVEG
jgi:hypothetical protein